MAVTRVNFQQAGNGSDTQISRVTPNFTVTAGNLIVVVIRQKNNGNPPTVADTFTNSYTRDVTANAATPYLFVYSAKANASGTNAVTVTWEGTDTFRWVAVMEYNAGSNTWNGTAASRLDTSSTNSGTGTTTCTAGAITTTQAETVLVFGVSQDNFTTYTVGANFSLVDGTIGDADEDFGGVQERMPNAILTTYAPTITSNQTDAYIVALAAYKTDAGAAGPNTWLPVVQVVAGPKSVVLPSGYTPPNRVP